jgi:DNA-binding NtrC family response regulator
MIMITGMDDVETALQAIKLGAYYYITKPPDTDKLFLTIKRALEQRLLELERDSLRSSATSPENKELVFQDIITESQVMFKVFELTEIFAPTNETVLIMGETGTGKDLIANKIHQLSPRKDKQFVVVNLASISSSLFESELFGHKKGAFTGALNEKIGYFEEASGGTIFLDEIGELPFELQGKLLRAIQYSEIYRIGNPKPIKLDIRIIAATNRDLADDVNNKKFRADLYYRLNRGFIKLPPLRKRGDDVILLAKYFLEIGNKTYSKSIPGFTDNLLNSLKKYSYPGNVRELENLILNSVAKSEDHKLIDKIHFDSNNLRINIDENSSTEFESNEENLLSIEDAVKKHIKNIMKHSNGNVQKAAVILGVSERTLQRRLQQMRKETTS